MFTWLKKRRERQNREIAKAVYNELTAGQGWERFLPPVAVPDTVYMVTENGSIYALRQDAINGFEQVVQIRKF